MKSTRIKYVCQNCGYESLKWLGKCPDCMEWNTLAEELVKPKTSHPAVSGSAQNIKSISQLSSTDNIRIATNIKEFDRVLGGGLIIGSVVLIAGDPGIGKSTLVMQAVSNIQLDESASKSKVVYVTGEESAEQLKYRSERLKLKSENVFILSETNLNDILFTLEKNDPAVAVIDSIQTIHRPELGTAPGTVGQIRECTAYLMQLAKKRMITVIIIGHVTKDGAIAGPKLLEHMVDTVLQFGGEKNYSFRILRAMKNRFGSTNEIGIFEMHDSGLAEVANPSEVFLSQREYGASGSVVTSVIEGTRPILVEVQALATPSNYGMPQRVTTGFDYRRLSILLAVLEKRLGYKLSSQNVFLNIAGGVDIDEPAADLAVCSAVISSIKDIPADSKTCVVGEVGLGGEIRSIHQLEKRISEAEKLGFEKILIPKTNSKIEKKNHNISILEVKTLREAIQQLFE
ncbi:MAG: DNA repair protein RadA [Ignavibacteria bacterium]|nr:DNA repair protein RadA [Ignavibacteria bacterium]